MALKFVTNAEALGKVLEKKVTDKEITNWAIAGLLNTMSGRDGKVQSFPSFVREKYLENGKALNIGEEDERWKRERDWHHYMTFYFYRPKRKKRKKPEVHAGMYGLGIRRVGGETNYLGPLNYINQNLKEPGYIRDAWKAYRGQKKTKENLSWMLVHGIEKKTRKVEDETV